MVANLQNVWRQGLVKLDNCKVFLVLLSWQSFIVGQCHLSHQALVKSGVESRRSNNGLKCMINIGNQPAPDQCQCYVKSAGRPPWPGGGVVAWWTICCRVRGELSPFLPFVNITSDQPGESGGRDNRFLLFTITEKASTRAFSWLKAQSYYRFHM